ncbi:MAG: PrsW family glutamic-type intramembrane protease, partial [Archangium sp.]
GLGFALVENVGYLMGAESISGFLGIFVMRAVLAVPGHAIYAGFMGYWTARRRFDDTGPGVAGGLLIAIGFHGAYDAAIFLCAELAKTGGPAAALVLLLIPIPVVVVIAGFFRSRKHAREALALDDVTHAPKPLPRLPAGMGFILR